MKSALSILFAVMSLLANSQSTLDSLRGIIEDSETDTNLVKLYVLVHDEFRNTDNDSTLFYAVKVKELSDELGYSKGELLGWNLIGNAYYRLGQYDKALEAYITVSEISSEYGDEKKKRSAFNNIGIINLMLEDYDEALRYFHLYRSETESAGDTVQAMKVSNSIGETHRRAKNLDSALIYFEEFLAFAERAEVPGYKAVALNNIGNIYHNRAEYDKAIVYYEEALEIKIKNGSTSSLAIAYNNIAENYARVGDPQKAERNYRKGLEIAEEVKALEAQKTSHHGLYETYEGLGRTGEALDHFKSFVMLKDSLLNESKQQIMLEMEAKYENAMLIKEKAEIQRDKMAKEAQLAKAQKDKIEAKRESEQSLYIAGGIALVLVFVGVIAFVYRRRNLQRKKANALLTRKNEEIAEKSKEILDSIQYAKRLQTAILPNKQEMHNQLGEHFVLYKPKDIVAGDFYWMESVDGHTYLAVADCTGHGVPGAMVSVVCSNALSKALIEEKITDPGKLLDRTRDLVIQRFGRSEEEIKDGMDICLVKLVDNKIEYAGANNPLWIFKGEDGEFDELKPDKQPIGKHAHEDPFTTKGISLSKGDRVYLFTDGYSDQFGGDRGKKMKMANFRKYLWSIIDRPMDKQGDLLGKHHEEWRGDIEQIDDVCVIGVRL